MNASAPEYQDTLSNEHTQRIFVLPAVDPSMVVPPRQPWPQTAESTSDNTDQDNSLRTGRLSLSLSTTFLHTLLSPEDVQPGKKITPEIDESSPGVFSTHAFLRVEAPPDTSLYGWFVDPAPLVVTEMEGIHLSYSGRVALFSLPLRSLNLATQAHPTSIPVHTRRALTSGVPIRLHGPRDTQGVEKSPFSARSKQTDGHERSDRVLGSEDQEIDTNTSASCFLELRLQARPYHSPVTTTMRSTTTTDASTTTFFNPQVRAQRHKRPQSGLGKHPHLRGHNARHVPAVGRWLEEDSFSFFGRQVCDHPACMPCQ